jgi:hypothetical protein
MATTERQTAALMGTVLWSFMSQRGCYEPALPVIDELSLWDRRPLDRLQMAAKTYQAARQSAELVEALIK